jgi:hypothetical protein
MAKEKLEVVSESQGSTVSKNSVIDVGGYFTLETSLCILRGEVVDVTDHEIVVKPFRFDQTPMIRYHNGLSEPFLTDMIVSRHQLVMAKVWSPA